MALKLTLAALSSTRFKHFDWLHLLFLQGAHEGIEVILRLVLFLVPQLSKVLQHGLEADLPTLLGLEVFLRRLGHLVALAGTIEGEEVKELIGAHGAQAGVLLADDGVRNIQLELLKPETNKTFH